MEVFIEIEPGLFLGNKEAAKNKHVLLLKRIHGIVNCAKNLENFLEQRHQISPFKEFEYLRLEMTEWSPITPGMIDKVIEFISWNKVDHGGILVHCAAAMQRSPSVIVAYLMKTRKISLQEAISIVEQKTAGQYYPSLETLESLVAMDTCKKTSFDHYQFFKSKEKEWLKMISDLGEDVRKKYDQKISQVIQE